MKQGEVDNGGAGQAAERLDALVEDVLREAVTPPAVDLKARVMAAWDHREPGTARRAPVAFPLFRPGFAIVSVVVIVAAALLLWPRANTPAGRAPAIARQSDRAPAPGEPQRSAIPSARPAPQPTSPLVARRAGSGRPASGTTALARHPRRPTVVVEFPVESLVAANGASLPGAPAGELGDPIAPLAGPPALAVPPVLESPTMSETARPVTDFPAEDEPPGEVPTQPGQAEGER